MPPGKQMRVQPHGIVVATRIAGREAGREGAQKVISPRRGAHGEEEPRTLEVRQQGELLQQPHLVEQPSVGVSGHKPRVPERGAEGNEPALRLGCVTTPDIGPELGDARRGRASIAVVHPRFAEVSGDTRPGLDYKLSHGSCSVSLSDQDP